MGLQNRKIIFLTMLGVFGKVAVFTVMTVLTVTVLCMINVLPSIIDR